MTRKALCLFPLLLLSTGCWSQTGTPSAKQDVAFGLKVSYDKGLVPDNVILKVSNFGKSYLCIPIAETRLGGGEIFAVPDDGQNYGNRAPKKSLAGLDISEGMYVLKGGETQDIYVNLSNGSAGMPASLKGTVRAARCEDLFKPGEAAIAHNDISIRIAK